MSLTLKIGSLAIKTLAKPIANYIKRNAHEHESFRKVCVGFAQRLHRIDMRMRLGLLNDSATIERQIAKEAAEAEAKRKRSQIPTVKTEAQTKADNVAALKERAKDDKAGKPKPSPKIRPLSEAKAIETGANFISETFMFIVAGSAIVFEQWRSRRKASERRGDIEDRIESLEREKGELSERMEKLLSSLEDRAAAAASQTASGTSVKQSDITKSPIPAGKA